MSSQEQIRASFQNARQLVSSIKEIKYRKEYKESNVHIIEENGKSELILFVFRIEGINKPMQDLKRILKEKEESIKKLLKSYLEVQT